jgi:hypothetical protein
MGFYICFFGLCCKKHTVSTEQDHGVVSNAWIGRRNVCTEYVREQHKQRAEFRPIDIAAMLTANRVASDRRRMNRQDKLASMKTGRSRGRKTARERVLAARLAAAVAGNKRVASERAEALAPIIAEIRAAGAATLRDIAAELNQRSIPTARGTASWSRAQVKRVMSRPELRKFRLGSAAVNVQIASERAAALAPIIAEIRATGATSLRAIVAELTKRGIPTARGIGRWSASQVARIMLHHEARKTRRRKSSQRA